MLIALAQIPVVPLDIPANVVTHVHAVEAAGCGGSGVWRPGDTPVTADSQPGVWLFDLDDPAVGHRLGTGV